jgi:hypothetical protein|tara:strand:+ start:1121 stop:1312 length:192 start_codon:yes stop_codon:yes gene_type:complete
MTEEKKKPKLTERAKNFLAETKEKIRKNNIKWYLTHPGWWGTEEGKQLKEHWGIDDVEELKDK